jgi:ABC-type branched-subunit amino acid transport system substrate-binding protein
MSCARIIFDAGSRITRKNQKQRVNQHRRMIAMGYRDRTTGAPWRVGVLFSTTGMTSVIEQMQLQATRLAIEEVNRAWLAGEPLDGLELLPCRETDL